MKQRVAQLLLQQPEDQQVQVAGWVRTKRDVGELSFLEINDGSILTNIQKLLLNMHR